MKKILDYFKKLTQQYKTLDISKVYIGVYETNNEESLFYKIDFNNYYDIKLKRNVSYEEIQKNSLIPYNSIIKSKGNSEKTIINLYDLDRIEKIKLSRVYIGSSYQITEVLGRDIRRYGPGMFDTITTTSVNKILVEEDLLLLATSDYLDYADFINLENGDKYKTPYYPEYGDIYIPIKNNIITAAFELNICGKDVEKKKLLEKYREYKRR